MHKSRRQNAQGWAGNKSETSFGTKLVLYRCTWTYIGREVHGCTTVEDDSNGLAASLFYDFDLYCLMQFALPINSTTAAFIKRRGLANCRTFAMK